MSFNDPHTAWPNGWIVFDGACGFCSHFVGNRANFFARYGFGVVPFQEPWVSERFGIQDTTTVDEIQLLLPSGKELVGAKACIKVMASIWWLRPLSWLFSLPLLAPLADRSYRFIAKRRIAISQSCGLASKSWFQNGKKR